MALVNLGENIVELPPARAFADMARPVRFRQMSRATARALSQINRPRQPLTFLYEGHGIKLAPQSIGPPLHNPLRVDLNASPVLGPVDIDRYLIKRLVGLADAGPVRDGPCS